MIVKLIGKKRAIILGALLGVNAALGGLYFAVIDPMQTEAQSKVTSAQSEISSLQSRIQGIKQDLEDYKKNLPIYMGLKDTGFLSDQDRFALSAKLTEIQKKSKLESFAYTIDDLKTLANSDAEAAKANLMVSRIQLDKINVMLDSDFYAFLGQMQKDFPAQLRLNSFSLKKVGTPDEETLKKIAHKETVPMVTADAKFDWLTFVPLPAPEPEPGAAGGAGAPGMGNPGMGNPGMGAPSMGGPGGMGSGMPTSAPTMPAMGGQ